MNLFKLLSGLFFGAIASACSQSNAQYDWVENEQKNVDVVIIDQFKNLKLFLNNTQNKPYHNFKALNQAMESCHSVQFAMNAGMYHADYSAVGLYIEAGQQYTALNQDEGYGNFFMQPNGVFAWNTEQAIIKTTTDYVSAGFVANYATQSGPMLVINGEINPQFIIDSQSLKIRNGVGVKENRVYFVISRRPISFYDFAKVFKDDLAIEQALYLDGSVSSIYLPGQGLNTQRAKLGPIIALLADQQCDSMIK